MSNCSTIRNFMSSRTDADYYIRRGGVMSLDISNIPEDYTPIGNVYYSDSSSFNAIQNVTYIGMSIEKSASDYNLICIKKEHLDLVRKYILFRMSSMSTSNIERELDSIIDMFKYFKIQFENTISTVYNDPILVNTITETYTSDRIKELLKDKLFSNKEVIESTTTEVQEESPLQVDLDNLPF
jgi:hypothetical protein